MHRQYRPPTFLLLVFPHGKARSTRISTPSIHGEPKFWTDQKAIKLSHLWIRIWSTSGTYSPNDLVSSVNLFVILGGVEETA